MDSLDIRIIRVLIQDETLSPLNPDFRRSFRTIARRLDVSEGTVRRRIGHLTQTGFLSSWSIMANPVLRGEGQVAQWFDVPEDTAKLPLVERLLLVPGAILVGTYFGALFTLVLQYREEAPLKRTIELVSMLAKAKSLYVGRIPFPESTTSLTDVDWRILRSLQEGPRRPLKQIAEALGLSSRTVRRRLQRLIQELAVFALPGINPRALKGSVLASVTVRYSMDDKAVADARLYPKFERYLWHVLHTFPFKSDDLAVSALNLVLPNVAEAEEILRWLRDQKEVTSERVDFHEEIHVVMRHFADSWGSRIIRNPGKEMHRMVLSGLGRVCLHG